jgi:endoglucanase
MSAAYKARMEPAVRAWLAADAKHAKDNPFGVFIGTGGWAGSGQVVEAGLTHAALRKAFPNIVPADGVFRALDYLYGAHPGSNLSLVSGVGTQSKEVAYGNNRADFSFIAGGVVPGVLIIKPDLPENKEDWPFLWGENEYVVNVAAGYMLLAQTANALANGR